MVERAFVLVPLAEIAGDVTVPGSAHTVSDLLENIEISGLRYFEPPSWAND